MSAQSLGSRVRRLFSMTTLRRALTVPASESQMALALGLSLVTMTMLLLGILWQSGIISYQRQIIQFLNNYK
jgi:hypothetical protein